MTYLSRFKPVNLHIAHSWGGGLRRWIWDFCARDDRSENLVLRSSGTENAYGLRLTLSDGRSGELLDSVVLGTPICETAIDHPEYARWLRHVCDTYRVGHLYVSSFIGHALDVLDTGIPTTVVYHDYYPYCVGLFLYFDGQCVTCGPEDLAACLRSNPLASVFRQHSPPFRQALREAYFCRLLRPGIRHVCPTRSVADTLRAIDPRFAAVPFHVIPHGVDPAPDCFGGAEEGRRLRTVLLGRHDPSKGSEQFHALFPRLQLLTDVYLLGSGLPGRAFAERANAHVVEQYADGGLTPLLERIRPDLALFLSLVPETFSYTLSEAHAHALPACARPVGAFTERIEPHRNGFFCDPDLEGPLRLLLALDEDRERLRSVHESLAASPPHGIDGMVDAYYALRDDYVGLAASCLR